ncbi:DUF2513 domain-containing protein [Paraglaciecola sp. L3A3]|uniref:DUF2513 domain-containing protein n=1 Tax=Paraglaciecola sp. L3A3 TaxID=2686358 RepID=UPI00131BA166|nr:DUF2513 domain-containing protein [Paraglaciecola sp. L3A3]
MQRNWDTVREIMLKVEALEPTQMLSLSEFEKDRDYEISYHVQMLEEIGLIRASISRTISKGANGFNVKELTWHGHEFLDSVREQSTWSKTKTLISSKGGVMTFEVIKTVAASLVKSAIGE